MPIHIILTSEIALYVIFNLIVAYRYSVNEMKESLIDERNPVERVFAVTFYALAWALKGLRFAVIKLIK